MMNKKELQENLLEELTKQPKFKKTLENLAKS